MNGYVIFLFLFFLYFIAFFMSSIIIKLPDLPLTFALRPPRCVIDDIWFNHATKRVFLQGLLTAQGMLDVIFVNLLLLFFQDILANFKTVQHGTDDAISHLSRRPFSLPVCGKNYFCSIHGILKCNFAHMHRNLAIYDLINEPLTVSNTSSRGEAETFDVELHDE